MLEAMRPFDPTARQLAVLQQESASMDCDNVVDGAHVPLVMVNTLPTASPATQVLVAVQERAVNGPTVVNAGRTEDHWSTIGAPAGRSVIFKVLILLRIFFALTVTT